MSEAGARLTWLRLLDAACARTVDDLESGSRLPGE